MVVAIFFFVIGLAILIVGAEALVRGSASIAKKLRISSLVIGLTVVAFGTSMPELVVNMFSAWRGTADIAIGNVIGSNIANILLILGIAAIIYPLRVKGSTVWKEVPFAVLAVALVFLLGNDVTLDGGIKNIMTRTDGLVLMAFFIIFMFYIFGLAKTEGKPEDIKVYSWAYSIISTLLGLGLLCWGGKMLVDNSIVLARLAGLSEALIGLTIVAVGTSLPELATSVIAAIHHHDDIAIGNVVGSNIFNVFWILGLTSTILPLPFNSAVNFDVLVCLITTVLLFLFMFVGTRRRLDRWQGAMFILLYAVYIAYLVYRG
ncbi:MAG: calcium/sodium antiporter [Candidatus Magasanikbacteria bacterium]|nr:calcium/sodium antiporter [Candidatus Magasanikbacteria bacterium]